MTISRNMQAFLDTIGFSEGTSTHPKTAHDGYDVIVTGIDGKPEVFSSFYEHPFVNRAAKQINAAGLTSTASGRYQILYRFWKVYKQQLGLKDFGPAAQDAVAIQLIKECKAVQLIESGQFALAVAACKSRWASLPGANYPGQKMHKIETLLACYKRCGGTLS